jgi:hypothetical protein
MAALVILDTAPQAGRWVPQKTDFPSANMTWVALATE